MYLIHHFSFCFNGIFLFLSIFRKKEHFWNRVQSPGALKHDSAAKNQIKSIVCYRSKLYNILQRYWTYWLSGTLTMKFNAFFELCLNHIKNNIDTVTLTINIITKTNCTLFFSLKPPVFGVCVHVRCLASFVHVHCSCG